MKYLYLILAIGALSCSKDKPVKNGIEIWAGAKIVENKWWAVNVNSPINITSTGTVTAEWDVYNTNNDFLYKRSATVPYSFTGGLSTSFEKSIEQGSISMVAKNIKILSISGSGGYVFKY